MIDHTEIFRDLDTLPTFNSHAIESRIHRIFRHNGVSTYSCSRALIGDGGPTANEYSVTSAAKNGRALMFDEFRRFPTTKIKHTPHAQQRRVIAEIEQRFPQQYRSVGRHQFRAPADISVASSLLHHVGEALGWAVHQQLPYEYVSLGVPDLAARLDTLLSRPRFHTWCLNDTVTTLCSYVAASGQDPDVIKIDAEGFEDQVLLGGQHNSHLGCSSSPITPYSEWTSPEPIRASSDEGSRDWLLAPSPLDADRFLQSFETWQRSLAHCTADRNSRTPTVHRGLPAHSAVGVLGHRLLRRLRARRPTATV